MHSRSLGLLSLGGIASILLANPPARAEEAKKAAKITYEEHVSSIFKNRCNGCHNADKQKGGLNLETFGTAMQGGGSGKVVEPGDLDASTLFQLVTHQDQPTMPPNAPKIPEPEIEAIKLWIEGGAPETSGSVALVKAKPKLEFKVDATAMGKPAGPPAMPEGLSVEPSVVTSRPTAIVAMAASPWAPLVAIGGYKQVLLYHTEGHRLVGVLPFPEGTIHVLRFSRNGAILLAGGGRGGHSGLAVAYDVKSGRRVFEVGKEYDAVLAADISPDLSLVALGGPSKVLRVFNTGDGEIAYQSKKHTEWVTAVEFSPDGVLLASGDRNNGLLVWEAETGREFSDLRGHTAAISDISWRPDSNVVATASEDGTLRLWEMENGRQIKSINAHQGGVSSVRYTQDGRIVTAGRDRITRLWDANGNKVRDFEAFNDLALEAVANHDNSQVIAGDWTGEVRCWDLKDGRRLANLAANPAPLATRIEQTRRDLAAAEAALETLATLQDAPAEKSAALDRAQAALAEARRVAGLRKGELAAAERSLDTQAAAARSGDDRGNPEAPEQTAADQVGADRAAAAAASLDELRAEVRKATAALSSHNAAIEQATIAKAAADKAFAASKAAIEAALVRANRLRAELVALERDKQVNDTAQAKRIGSTEGSP